MHFKHLYTYKTWVLNNLRKISSSHLNQVKRNKNLVSNEL